MKKTYEIVVSAIVEFDDEEFDKNDLESSAVICFLKTNTYDDSELFLPKMGSMEVIDYTDLHIIDLNEGNETD